MFYPKDATCWPFLEELLFPVSSLGPHCMYKQSQVEMLCEQALPSALLPARSPGCGTAGDKFRYMYIEGMSQQEGWHLKI